MKKQSVPATVGKPAAGSPANVATAQRRQVEPARGDVMLADTYVDEDDLQQNTNSQLDDFDARITGGGVATAPLVTKQAVVANHRSSGGTGDRRSAGPPPMRSQPAAAPRKPTGASKACSVGDDGEVDDRTQDISDVAALPDDDGTDDD